MANARPNACTTAAFMPLAMKPSSVCEGWAHRRSVDATSRDQADRWTSLAPIVFANASVAAVISHLPDTGMTAPDDEFVLTPTEPAQSG
jgi:hypothetical protein